jgi:hypothetical protein
MRELKKRNRLLEQENEILRRAAGLSGKGHQPKIVEPDLALSPIGKGMKARISSSARTPSPSGSASLEAGVSSETTMDSISPH